MTLERWMSELAADMPTRTLFDTVIPGSHDACSYAITQASPVAAGDAKVSLAQRIARALRSGAVADWSKTQGLSLAEQLLIGARYFDVRICLHDGAYWTCHGLVSAPWEACEAELLSFASAHPGEVCILDFHEFYGLDDHGRDFCGRVQERFGARAVSPARVRDPLGELGRDGLSFVLRAAKGATRHESAPTFIDWGLLDSEAHWSNTSNVEVLRGQIRYHLGARDPNQLDVVQGVLSLDEALLCKVALEPAAAPNSLRALAQNVTPVLVSWVEKAARSNVNIVMADWVDRAFCEGVVRLNRSGR